MISGILVWGWGRYDNWYVNYMKKNAESDKPFTVNRNVRERLDLDILHGEKKLSQILLITIWIADPLFQNMGARYIPTVT